MSGSRHAGTDDDTTGDMMVFRTPPRALVGDYVRSLAGLTVGAGVLLSVPPTPVIVGVFGGLFGLFFVFGMRTLDRHLAEIAITEHEIGRRGLSTRSFRWDQLERLKLRFYGTARGARSRISNPGFMQLTLKGSGRAVVIEDSIEGFSFIAWRAARAARDNGVGLDPASAGNLLELGIDADSDQPPPAAEAGVTRGGERP